MAYRRPPKTRKHLQVTFHLPPTHTLPEERERKTGRAISTGHNTEAKMGNDMGRSANRMAIGAMANATHFEKKELLRLQVCVHFRSNGTKRSVSAWLLAWRSKMIVASRCVHNGHPVCTRSVHKRTATWHRGFDAAVSCWSSLLLAGREEGGGVRKAHFFFFSFCCVLKSPLQQHTCGLSLRPR